MSLSLLITSLVAGGLTVLAPCILPLIPVVIGVGADKSQRRAPLVVVGSLAASVVVFSLLLKASTALIGVPAAIWTTASGGLLAVLGLLALWPQIWERAAIKLNLAGNRWLGRAASGKGYASNIAIGAALGPVFSSCSPTYGLIVAVIIPQSLNEGLVYLLAYVLGLAAMLLLVAYGGQRVIGRLGWLSDSHGRVRRVLGAIILITGVLIIFGLDKDLQAWLIDRGLYDPLIRLEERF